MPTKVVPHKSAAGDNDPLAVLPPLSETVEERTARLMTEREAKAISDKIDADLEKLITSDKRGPRPVKILLLGMSFAEIFIICC
jgi:guanine nucleotide-binding protein subunit alpha